MMKKLNHYLGKTKRFASVGVREILRAYLMFFVFVPIAAFYRVKTGSWYIDELLNKCPVLDRIYEFVARRETWE